MRLGKTNRNSESNGEQTLSNNSVSGYSYPSRQHTVQPFGNVE
jgi:hypothetical protein